MLTVRRSAERGHFDHGWLDTRHTFSFAGYKDADHMGFGALRVINEDIVQPGAGFDMHPHQDMEIITWVLSGELEHSDSLGQTSINRRGHLQRMSAGTGITHSERNASAHLPLHLMQIWLTPDRPGRDPGYERRHLPLPERLDKLRLAASRDGDDGSVRWNQGARLWVAELRSGVIVEHALEAGRRAWVQVTSGRLALNAVGLAAGDGAAVEGVAHLDMAADGECAFLLFDLE